MLMTDFAQQYFFLSRPRHEALPYLQPTKETAALNFRFEPVPRDSKPLKFCNGLADSQKDRVVAARRSLPEVLFSGTDLVVRSSISERLLKADIPNLVVQASIYIDESNVCHEDYWYLTFTKRFDCWDREKSDYRAKPLELGGMALYSVYEYKLNEELLATTALKDRQLFKMGGVNPAPVTVHKSLAGVFRCVPEAALQLVAVDR